MGINSVQRHVQTGLGRAECRDADGSEKEATPPPVIGYDYAESMTHHVVISNLSEY
jgi:hypothetical protein